METNGHPEPAEQIGVAELQSEIISVMAKTIGGVVTVLALAAIIICAAIKACAMILAGV